jgi:hypothetical protein
VTAAEQSDRRAMRATMIALAAAAEQASRLQHGPTPDRVQDWANPLGEWAASHDRWAVVPVLGLASELDHQHQYRQQVAVLVEAAVDVAVRDTA